MALETFCDNCGCNISERTDSRKVFHLTLQVPKDKKYDFLTKEYDLCCCCASGIAQVLDENIESIHNLHGVNCVDVLPMGYRCAHSPSH